MILLSRARSPGGSAAQQERSGQVHRHHGSQCPDSEPSAGRRFTPAHEDVRFPERGGRRGRPPGRTRPGRRGPRSPRWRPSSPRRAATGRWRRAWSVARDDHHLRACQRQRRGDRLADRRNSRQVMTATRPSSENNSFRNPVMRMLTTRWPGSAITDIETRLNPTGARKIAVAAALAAARAFRLGLDRVPSTEESAATWPPPTSVGARMTRARGAVTGRGYGAWPAGASGAPFGRLASGGRRDARRSTGPWLTKVALSRCPHRWRAARRRRGRSPASRRRARRRCPSGERRRSPSSRCTRGCPRPRRTAPCAAPGGAGPPAAGRRTPTVNSSLCGSGPCALDVGLQRGGEPVGSVGSA